MSSRLSDIKENFSKRIQDEYLAVSRTIADWIREEEPSVYFNGKKAFDSSAERNEITIPAVIEKNLQNTQQDIIDYIKKGSHQSGFLNVSQMVTNAHMFKQRHKLLNFQRRFDFIENLDGSVTFIERLYVDNYIEPPNNEKVKPEKENQSIAICVTESTISIHEGQIQHEFSYDKIFLTDELGKELFNASDSAIEERYGETPEVTAELNEDIRFGALLHALDKQIDSLSSNRLINTSALNEIVLKVNTIVEKAKNINWTSFQLIISNLIELIHSRVINRQIKYNAEFNFLKNRKKGLESILESTVTLKANQQEFNLACKKLEQAVKQQNQYPDLKIAGNGALKQALKAGNKVKPRELSALTKFVKGTADVVAEPNSQNIEAHAKNTKKAFGINRPLGRIIGGAMLCVLGTALIAAALAATVFSFGATLPLIIPALAICTKLIVVGTIISAGAAAPAAVTFLTSAAIFPAALGGGLSVTVGGLFANKGRKGLLGAAGEKVTEEAKKLPKPGK